MQSHFCPFGEKSTLYSKITQSQKKKFVSKQDFHFGSSKNITDTD